MHNGEKELLMTLSLLYMDIAQLRPTRQEQGLQLDARREDWREEHTDLEEGDARLCHSLQNHAHSMR